MKVRMLTDRRGSPDGITAVLYRTGQVYWLPPDLALPWLEKGYCEEDKELVLEVKAEAPAEAPVDQPMKRGKVRRK